MASSPEKKQKTDEEAKDINMTEDAAKVEEEKDEAKIPEPPKAPEPPKELEEDAKKDSSSKIKDVVSFLPADSTVNVLSAATGNVLMSASDGPLQYLLAGARANVGVKSGRYMFEVKVVEQIHVVDDMGRTKNPMSKHAIRIGFTTGRSVLLGQDNETVGFDCDGLYLSGKTKEPRAFQACGSSSSLAVVLNLDNSSSNFNTVSMFVDGKRVCQPKPLPEALHGKTFFPCVSFKNSTLHVNFNQPAAPLPFTCNVVQEAATKDASITKHDVPKDGKYKVLFPVGLPDQGTFDWLDAFLEKHLDYSEISDRSIIDWIEKSGFAKMGGNKASIDRPDTHFGQAALDNIASIKKAIYNIASVQPRNFVVMEVLGNLTKEHRITSLAKFKTPLFKAVAEVMVGDPPEDFVKLAHQRRLSIKQDAANAAHILKMQDLKKQWTVRKNLKEAERKKKREEKEQKRLMEELKRKQAAETKRKDKEAAKARKAAERQLRRMKRAEEKAAAEKKAQEEAAAKAQEEAQKKAAEDAAKAAEEAAKKPEEAAAETKDEDKKDGEAESTGEGKKTDETVKKEESVQEASEEAKQDGKDEAKKEEKVEVKAEEAKKEDESSEEEQAEEEEVEEEPAPMVVEEEPQSEDEPEPVDPGPPKVELADEEKKERFFPRTMPDIMPHTLSTSFTNFSLPSKEDGFHEVNCIWNKEAKSAQVLSQWMLDKKLTARVDDLKPSPWFDQKWKDWQIVLQSWVSTQNAYRESSAKKAAAKRAKAEAKAQAKLQAKQEAERKAKEAEAKAAADKEAAEKAEQEAAAKEGEETKAPEENKDAEVKDAEGATEEKKTEDIEDKAEEKKAEHDSEGAQEKKGEAMDVDEGKKEEEDEADPEEDEADPEEQLDFASVDIFGAKDVCNIGADVPLFKEFAFEDMTLLSLRFELNLMVHAYRRDVPDPDRLGIHLDNVGFYYQKYLQKPLSLKFFGVENVRDLVNLVQDTVFVHKKDYLVSWLPAELESHAIFVKLTEEARRHRILQLDLGNESARLKIQPGNAESKGKKRGREGGDSKGGWKAGKTEFGKGAPPPPPDKGGWSKEAGKGGWQQDAGKGRGKGDKSAGKEAQQWDNAWQKGGNGNVPPPPGGSAPPPPPPPGKGDGKDNWGKGDKGLSKGEGKDKGDKGFGKNDGKDGWGKGDGKDGWGKGGGKDGGKGDWNSKPQNDSWNNNGSSKGSWDDGKGGKGDKGSWNDGKGGKGWDAGKGGKDKQGGKSWDDGKGKSDKGGKGSWDDGKGFKGDKGGKSWDMNDKGGKGSKDKGKGDKGWKGDKGKW